MNLDDHPPKAGQSGAQAPRQTPPKTPGEKKPLSELDLWALRKLERERETEAERQKLIRILEGRMPKKQAEHPHNQISRRARRLRGLSLLARDPDVAKLLGAHFNDLSDIFKDLIFHNAAAESFDEKFGLIIALRAQKQALETVRVAQGLEKQNTRPAKNEETGKRSE